MSALSGYGAASGQNHIAQTRIQLAPSNVTVSTLPRANEHPLFYMGILAAISITAVLLQVINVVAQFVGAFWGSRALFARLLDRVVYGTMRW